ncbi:MAG: hypothetical protein GY711_21100 [bacterium]|nr:hypothetical protein [bacterium]
MDKSELDDVRHGLKNVMTALASGCMLIESGLQPGAAPETREYLEEMRAELEKGRALVDRLREIKRTPSLPAD